MNRKRQLELYADAMGSEAAIRQVILAERSCQNCGAEKGKPHSRVCHYSPERVDTGLCACKHRLYEHSIRKVSGKAESVIGACEVPDCYCSTFRNPYYDSESIAEDAWLFVTKQER